MGHVSQIALGISEYSDKRVFCFDGDGSILMHMGGLATIAERQNNNFFHIVFDNEAHESVGGQKTISYNIDFEKFSKSIGYKNYFIIKDYSDFDYVFKSFKSFKTGPTFIHIKVKSQSRDELSRPLFSPKEHKLNFKRYFVN